MTKNGNNKGNSVHSDRVSAETKYPRQRSNALPQFEFIRVELTHEQKEYFIEGVRSGSLTMEAALGLVETGLKLSITRDDQNKCYIATLSDNRAGSPARYKCLSARGATTAIALCAVYYKHFFILEGDWLKVAPTQDLDDWGIG